MIHLKRIKQATGMLTVMAGMLLMGFASSAQITTDLNHHIKTTDPSATIVYTALKKGYVSVKADVGLVDGKLITSDNQSFEDLYLRPLFSRYQEKNGRIYQDYPGYFYLFIELNGDEKRAVKVLSETLTTYETMISGFKRDQQRRPLKVVLIGASTELATEIMHNESSLISLEGDPTEAQAAPYTIMPVVGLNHDHLDQESLRETARLVHRKGKKLRLYNVPDDQALWKTLMKSGVDFINSKKTQTLLSKAQ